MDKETMRENVYAQEIIELFRSSLEKEELLRRLSDYHESDVADAMEQMTVEERKRIYPVLGAEYMADVFSYLENAEEYLQEINLEKAAEVLSEMDSDDAIDILENIEEEDRNKIVEMLDEDAEKDVRMILSYDEDEIGSEMTTNFIVIPKGLNIKQATHELIVQAGENDNISTIYVVDENGRFYGVIDLKA